MDRTRRRLLTLPGLVLVAGGMRPSLAAATVTLPDGGALRLGLAPFLSPQALLTAFRPLREHLMHALQQPVELYTARDFRALALAVRGGGYDMSLLPAHLAALFAMDHGWTPLVRTISTTAVLLLTQAGGDLQTPDQLRGQRVAMLDTLSLTATVGLLWLREKGLSAPADLQVVVMPSINSALLALQRGEVAAVFAAESQLAALPPERTAATRVMQSLKDIPAPLIMARPGVPQPEQQRWRAALLAFEPDPARPRSAANVRLAPLSLADLAPLAPYADQARRMLAQPR